MLFLLVIFSHATFVHRNDYPVQWSAKAESEMQEKRHCTEWAGRPAGLEVMMEGIRNGARSQSCGAEISRF